MAEKLSIIARKEKGGVLGNAEVKQKSLKAALSIDKRPKYINQRKRIGDAEADFLVSGKTGKGIILNVTDRKSRLVFLEQILVFLGIRRRGASYRVALRARVHVGAS